jgi:putative two-component system response regulator
MVNLRNKPSVLVVDDDPICCEILAAVVESLGYPVVVATDGLAAFNYICNDNIRIVLSDWQMPGLSGVELCKRVRERILSDYVYFIMLTTLDRKQNLSEGVTAGVDDFLPKPYDVDEVIVRLKVAQRVVGLENKHLLVFSLAKLAESRDEDTGSHLERMREYSKLLAVQLRKSSDYREQITPDFIRAIYLTSPLHDIGKVGIPDRILLKPGRLTTDEFEIMKSHTLIGRDTLEASLQADPTAQYLRLARDIAAAHHERFNGTGYPYGLRGEEIPLAARIVAVADVYDALTTKRVYKEAYSHEFARQLIVEESGKHFDPVIVDAFVTIESQIVATKDRIDAPQNADGFISSPPVHTNVAAAAFA